ncbi:MAG: GspE/PulE family protein [Acidobacteriota bacterium]
MLDRLSTLVLWLALAVAVGGTWTCWRAAAPEDAASAARLAAVDATRAAATPTLWILLVAAAMLFVAAGRLERRSPSRPADNVVVVGASQAARSASKPRVDGAPMVLAEVPPSLRRDRERAVRRVQLEAFLRDGADVIGFVDRLLAVAVEEGASDIHLEPDGRATLRLSGEIEELLQVPPEVLPKVVRRLKVLAKVPPHVRARPLDGRIAVATPRGRIDVRLATLPAQGGERATLRLAGAAARRSFDALGLEDAARARLEAVLDRPQGLVAVVGPTGSGKTTTLYAALEHLSERRGGPTLASLEDPVEIDLPFVAQTQVDREAGLTFADALRAVLRQNPDVLMIGEVRDEESAGIAVQAALSGHLVLTTLHAESAVAVAARLVDLGVEPFLVASALQAVVAQRLLPRLCSDCRRPVALSPADRSVLEGVGLDPSAVRPMDADGCPQCDYRGTRGQVAVFEILEPDADLRRDMTRKAPVHELAEAAVRRGHRPLDQEALTLAQRGEVSVPAALSIAAREGTR